jgi:hypothetical protein
LIFFSLKTFRLCFLYGIILNTFMDRLDVWAIMKPDNDLAIPIFHKPVRLSLSDSLSSARVQAYVMCRCIYSGYTKNIHMHLDIYIYIRDIDTYTLYMYTYYTIHISVHITYVERCNSCEFDVSTYV